MIPDRSFSEYLRCSLNLLAARGFNVKMSEQFRNSSKPAETGISGTSALHTDSGRNGVRFDKMEPFQ